MTNIMTTLAGMVVTFRSNRIEVVHKIGFDASVEDAWKICTNYADFIRIMLTGQTTDPNPKWLKGGPGEIGAELEYTLVRDGDVNVIVERIVQLARDASTGVCTLAWEQTSSTPQLPLRQYGCTWVLTPEASSPDQPRCRLTWTRHFNEPMLLGLVSLANFMKDSFQETAFPIMNDVFRPYYNRMFPAGQRRLPRKSDRVLVVGAGPSGLHMAHVLKTRAGISDITIVERSERYGGKTVTVPDQTHEGVVHELGTCYLHPAYFAVRALLQELKHSKGCDLDGFADEVAPINYRIRQLGGSDLTLDEWITANLQRQPNPKLWALTRVLLPTEDTDLELEEAKVAYNTLHHGYFGDYNYSMPPKLTPEAMAALDTSFGQLLEANGLSVLMPILAYGQTCQGYGSIADTPAFWAMCWITPELLNGYFAILPRHLPKKSMLKTGWGSLWDTIVKVDDLQIELNTEIESIERRADGGPIVVKSTQTRDGGEPRQQTREFDYLVVAAPVFDPANPDRCFMKLTEEESSLLRSQHITNGQFRTVLFRLNQPKPYLDSHLTLDSDKVLGPTVGQGDVFASRDSYLAMHPEFCTLEGHQRDPARSSLREQMAYQYVETGRNMPDAELDRRFHAWAEAELGNQNAEGAASKPAGDAKAGPPANYEVLKTSPTWTYFQRFGRQGVLDYSPWRVLEMQGKNRTLFVHASTFFESVLDIVNYNNMLVDGLAGDLDTLEQPPSDHKPRYYETEHWRVGYNPVTRAALSVLDVALGVPWTAGYIALRPLLEPVIRVSRKQLQTAFHTKDPGPWWRFSMSHFLKVSPSVRSLLEHEEDPVVTLAKETLRRDYPEIPAVERALQWNFADYRTGVRVWQSKVKPTLLSFIGPRTKNVLHDFAGTFPIAYNYLFSWFSCITFNNLTGYSVRVEDAKGGGCFVPRCDMLRVARAEYGEEVGSRICTRVCKIFTEEYMASKGLPCVLEPNPEKGSCMIRGVAVKSTAFSDHKTAWWLDPAEESVTEPAKKKKVRLRTIPADHDLVEAV